MPLESDKSFLPNLIDATVRISNMMCFPFSRVSKWMNFWGVYQVILWLGKMGKTILRQYDIYGHLNYSTNKWCATTALIPCINYIRLPSASIDGSMKLDFDLFIKSLAAPQCRWSSNDIKMEAIFIVSDLKCSENLTFQIVEMIW